MPGTGRGSRDKPKSTTQSKLTSFGAHGAEQPTSREANTTKDANAASTEANGGDVNNEALIPPSKDQQLLNMAKDEILGEIHNLKSEFTGRFDGVLKAIEETRKEVTECTERMAGAEVRLSNVEDEQVDLKTVVESLQTRNKHLEDKVVDMETRLRLNNLRLVGLPENSEGFDMCGFLESWLPDALELNPMRHPLVLERAHRIGPKRDTNTSPRTVIMRFLNYKQKEIVLRTAKTKKDIFYKNQRVKLFADVAMEVHRQRKQFDVVRDQLRKLGVRHGILSPATLVLTYKEKVHKFTSPAEAKIFTQKIQMEMVETE
ncbi:LINE-1 type transposase domain-containing 1 [Labeo rohita]|uniref:LINE-1 type transposase domain-containing 1 n=1 Tax=Labeo rohita TaxID=84645 RepID=A0A498P4R0_LABRO|nr:LINE-1 type transposase domain-containing 1 [Labeo rohita]